MNVFVREVLFPSFHIALSSSSYLSTLSIPCSLFFWPYCMPLKKTHNIPSMLFSKNDFFSPLLKPPGKSVGGALCCALWLAKEVAHAYGRERFLQDVSEGGPRVQ